MNEEKKYIVEDGLCEALIAGTMDADWQERAVAALRAVRKLATLHDHDIVARLCGEMLDEWEAEEDGLGWVPLPPEVRSADEQAAIDAPIRAAALEEAAKVCEEQIKETEKDVNGTCGEWTYRAVAEDCAAGIRALKAG